jgi:hypothetical protein
VKRLAELELVMLSPSRKLVDAVNRVEEVLENDASDMTLEPKSDNVGRRILEDRSGDDCWSRNDCPEGEDVD